MTKRWFEFTDEITTDEFFVEAIDAEDAVKVAKNYFPEPLLIQEVSEKYADDHGFDFYC